MTKSTPCQADSLLSAVLLRSAPFSARMNEAQSPNLGITLFFPAQSDLLILPNFIFFPLVSLIFLFRKSSPLGSAPGAACFTLFAEAITHSTLAGRWWSGFPSFQPEQPHTLYSGQHQSHKQPELEEEISQTHPDGLFWPPQSAARHVCRSQAL